MFNEGDWQGKAAKILKIELLKRELTYKQLEEKLEAIGVKQTEATIKTKLKRGTFSAVFFLQCLHVMGAKTLEINT